jgi:hypothetical protein
LLGRTTSLLERLDPRRIELLIDLAFARADGGEYTQANEALVGAVESAEELDDRRLVTHSRVAQLIQQQRSDPDAEGIRKQALEAAAVLEEEGDDLGLARTWNLLAYEPYLDAQAGEVEDATTRAANHARRAGAHREEALNLMYLAEHGLRGTIPLSDGVRRCDELLERIRNRQMRFVVLCWRAVMEGLLSRAEAARGSLSEAAALAQEIGSAFSEAHLGWFRGLLELYTGDPAAAEQDLRPAYETTSQMGEELGAHQMALDLARSLLARGDFGEADQLASRVGRLAAPSYRPPQVRWRGIKALVLANRGETANAVELAREGVALADGSDWLELQGEVRLDLAEALVAAGIDQAAGAVLEEAIERFERKEDVVSARRARERLAQLSELPPART